MSQVVVHKIQQKCTQQVQTTHTMPNCALKDSNCDSPLSKMIKLTILASNSSLSSIKVLKWPHNKDNSIFTQNPSTIWSFEITYNSHTHKDEHKHYFTHKFPYFSINIRFSSLKITKVFSRLVTDLRVKVWSFKLNDFYFHEV